MDLVELLDRANQAAREQVRVTVETVALNRGHVLRITVTSVEPPHYTSRVSVSPEVTGGVPWDTVLSRSIYRIANHIRNERRHERL